MAAEAAAWLALAAVARRGLTFSRLARFADRRAAMPGRFLGASVTPRAVSWAVDAADRWGPWSFTCFERALAAHAMLRRRGIGSTLCYGARGDGSRGPSAHVWVRVGELDVLGGEEAARFAVLAVFPATRPAGL